MRKVRSQIPTFTQFNLISPMLTIYLLVPIWSIRTILSSYSLCSFFLFSYFLYLFVKQLFFNNKNWVFVILWFNCLPSSSEKKFFLPLLHLFLNYDLYINLLSGNSLNPTYEGSTFSYLYGGRTEIGRHLFFFWLVPDCRAGHTCAFINFSVEQF